MARHPIESATRRAIDERLAALLIDSVIGYAIFVLDPHGCIRSWNPGAERLKGYDADEVLGRHFSLFYPSEYRDAGLPETLLARAASEGAVEHTGWRVRKDGSRFWGNVTITALHDEMGELVGYAKLTRDLTETLEQEASLHRTLEHERQAAAELERLHRLRTRFLATIAHDLTTPAVVISTTAELLATGAVDDRDGTSLLVSAKRNADELLALAQQLRELSKLEGGQIELHPEPLSVATVVGELVEDLSLMQPEVHIAVDVLPDVRVQADQLALQRILTNLLTNAVGFSPAGTTVRVTASRRGEAIAIGVADAGPGIDEEEQTRVFDEFWRGTTGDRRDRGLGLGLSIVQQYVEQHGGEVWVDSVPGQGATFWFTLPDAGTVDG